MTFTRVFVLQRNFIQACGVQKKHFGGLRHGNALQWHWACYFVLGPNPRLVGTFLAWGARAVIWEG